jgi:hypothetical protein
MQTTNKILGSVPTAPGRKSYTCYECGKHGLWDASWRWFGSLKDLDNHTTKNFCSEECAVKWSERTGAKAHDRSTPPQSILTAAPSAQPDAA